jgi:hypothetical protein
LLRAHRPADRPTASRRRQLRDRVGASWHHRGIVDPCGAGAAWGGGGAAGACGGGVDGGAVDGGAVGAGGGIGAGGAVGAGGGVGAGGAIGAGVPGTLVGAPRVVTGAGALGAPPGGGVCGCTPGPPVAGDSRVGGPFPVPGPFGPAVPTGAGLDDVAGGPTGAGPLTTPGITTTGCCGAGGAGVAPLVGARVPTELGPPCKGADVSVTPPASGGGTLELLGPGAVDSPITGPITGGCTAGREHAPAPLAIAVAISAARRAAWAMARHGASRVPRAPASRVRHRRTRARPLSVVLRSGARCLVRSSQPVEPCPHAPSIRQR